ncbi:hypothetical protein IFR05_008417 [Cadophora sp. M221]|nr:hypothetical protein IFR05_008417 [Cadophora sp. M221]
MASAEESQYKMHPSRLQNLLDETAAQQQHKLANTKKWPYIGAKYFHLDYPNKRTMAKKTPSKLAVFFTFDKEKPKKASLPGKVQHHVIAKKATRRDRMKALKEMERLSEAHKTLVKKEREQGVLHRFEHNAGQVLQEKEKSDKANRSQRLARTKLRRLEECESEWNSDCGDDDCEEYFSPGLDSEFDNDSGDDDCEEYFVIGYDSDWYTDSGDNDCEE